MIIVRTFEDINQLSDSDLCLIANGDEEIRLEDALAERFLSEAEKYSGDFASLDEEGRGTAHSSWVSGANIFAAGALLLALDRQWRAKEAGSGSPFPRYISDEGVQVIREEARVFLSPRFAEFRRLSRMASHDTFRALAKVFAYQVIGLVMDRNFRASAPPPPAPPIGGDENHV